MVPRCRPVLSQASARRDRLRQVLAQMQGMADESRPDGGRKGEEGKDEAELFYTPGSDALKAARVAIGELSFAR